MKKIFIADDNEELLQLMGRLFSREYKVYCCSNADEMCKAVYECIPDLILIDNNMGNTNSETIIDELRKNDHSFSIPFLIFSAHPSIDEIAIRSGAHGYVRKPFDITYLRSYVKNIFQKISIA